MGVIRTSGLPENLDGRIRGIREKNT